MNRWPTVRFPARRPSTSRSTTWVSSASLNRQMIECSGRTHLRLPDPQRMDLGHGKSRMTASRTSATIWPAGRPSRSMTANHTCPFLPSRASRSSFESPVERRNPSSAFSGALTLGPLRSSRVAGLTFGKPDTVRINRRGVTYDVASSWHNPASARPSVTRRFKSSAAFACIRAGISSDRSSISRSGMDQVLASVVSRTGRLQVDQRFQGHWLSHGGGGGQSSGKGSPLKCLSPQRFNWCQT